MQMIYKDTEGRLTLLEAGMPAEAGSVPVALVRDHQIELLVSVEEFEAGKLRTLAKDAGVALPEDFPVDPEEVEKNAALPQEDSFESVKKAWGEAVRGTFSILKRELENSGGTRGAFERAASGLKDAGEKAGFKAGEGIKPTFTSSSNKAIIGVLSMVHRDLLSLKARLTEEALTTRLDSMTPEERAEFYALYSEKMTSSDDPKTAVNLTSWHKVIRRFMH